MIQLYSLKIILKNLRELIEIDPKERISNPEEIIPLEINAYTNRKALKHIINSRQHDGYNQDKLLQMFIRTGEVVENPHSTIPNHNRKYPQSLISNRNYGENQTLLVIHIPIATQQFIFNAFYRHRTKYEKLRKRSKY